MRSKHHLFSSLELLAIPSLRPLYYPCCCHCAQFPPVVSGLRTCQELRYIAQLHRQEKNHAWTQTEVGAFPSAS